MTETATLYIKTFGRDQIESKGQKSDLKISGFMRAFSKKNYFRIVIGEFVGNIKKRNLVELLIESLSCELAKIFF